MLVTIVDTRAANLASVRAAFERLGCDVRTTTDAALVREAEAVVLPGVGAFGPAMDRLRERGLDVALRERMSGGSRATLAICLGMQLLLEASEESPGVRGLGIVAGVARRFGGARRDIRVPQMGWNQVRAMDERWAWPARNGEVYFANSYRLEWESGVAPDWSALVGEYGGPFVAAVARECVLACQFHPELSGRFGKNLLAAWLGRAKRALGRGLARGVVPC
jgi:imidazole glycerol phosphate synthase glutamine amidotransferase subunit